MEGKVSNFVVNKFPSMKTTLIITILAVFCALISTIVVLNNKILTERREAADTYATLEKEFKGLEYAIKRQDSIEAIQKKECFGKGELLGAVTTGTCDADSLVRKYYIVWDGRRAVIQEADVYNFFLEWRRYRDEEEEKSTPQDNRNASFGIGDGHKVAVLDK